MEPIETKDLETNEIELIGQVETLDGSFENHGKTFNRATIRVERLSGAADYIPVVYSGCNLNLLDKVKILGSIRSRNLHNTETGKSKLIVYVFVKEIETISDEEYSTSMDINSFTIVGYICKPVVYRETPKHIKICDLMIAYNNTFNRSFYIPSLVFGKLTSKAIELKTGDKVEVKGRFQSRDYTKVTEQGPITKTTYELAISEITLFVEEEK